MIHVVKEIQSFLFRHSEYVMGRNLKLPDFQVLWHGRFLASLIFLGNMNNAVFSLTSILSFGFDDWSWETS